MEDTTSWPELLRVEPEDVDRPFPLLAVVLALELLACAGALLLAGRASPVTRAPPLPWAGPLAAAALALLLVHILL